jgi:hypothetical protein
VPASQIGGSVLGVDLVLGHVLWSMTPAGTGVFLLPVQDRYSTDFGFCDTNIREKDWRCRKRGMQAT